MRTPRGIWRNPAPWLLNWRVLALMVGIAFLMLCLALTMLWASRRTPSPMGISTAVLNVVRASTATPNIVTPSPVVSPTGSSSIPPSPMPGVITVEAYVQISGTGGDGLRLRTEPGLNSPVHTLGSEAEVFQVKDGPREVDGFTWWYLIGPFDPARFGWAASNYLMVVQNP